jgi:hypothetical protein
MHATLAEILENHKSGLLWVNSEGVVRYANGDACARTGLAAGGKLYDPDLARAVTAAVLGRVSGVVTATGRPAAPGDVVPELKCRVVPGLARDDAFVFIRDESATDHDVAFENLMQVIRSDLAEPLRRTHDSLTMAVASDPHALEPLLATVGETLQVLDKLLDLAGIWTSGALLATDRIELWGLLQQVWGELQPLALSRSVKVRFKSQDDLSSLATLYGSETWLRRVFLECLEAAIRAARGGSSLVIEHRQMGPRALIVFRDSGVFGASAEGIELTATGSASTRPVQGAAAARPKLAAREHIGLQLCRHIVSLHGGQLREEHEDGERHFLIDLPTGAPHRTDTSQIDIAQAQRYATDLAALMARARGSRH